MSARLHKICRRKGIVPTEAAEVGVYFPETSNILEFIRDGVPAMLVEADPVCVERIRQYFSSYPNVTIHACAVWANDGRVRLYRASSSTFVGELEGSPAQVNDAYVQNDDDSFEAEARRFSEIDSGTIDLLSIDIEGAEWHVLNHLISRPRIITLETHAAQYLNPNMSRILCWMDENGYEIWFMDGTDSVFAKSDMVRFSGIERRRNRMKYAWAVFRNRLKAMKRSLRKRISG